jgi:hypothetical protein
MPDDERHLLRRAKRRGTYEVAFVLPIVVVGHDDEFAACDGLDGLGDGLNVRRQRNLSTRPGRLRDTSERLNVYDPPAGLLGGRVGGSYGSGQAFFRQQA